MLRSGVKIVRLSDKKEEPMHVLAARTYVNRDSTKVVPEGSPEAAFLLGLAGDEISDETAARLGLGTSVPTVPAYGSMKVVELREVAAERGVEIASDAKKAEIVEALEGADATAATGGTADVGAPTEV